MIPQERWLADRLAAYKKLWPRAHRHLDGLVRYVEQRIAPGGCLRGLLENNLRRFMHHADADALASIEGLYKFVYNELPASCWGSEDLVNSWLSSDDLPSGVKIL